ncbi:MAG: GNAT family N-acetyltransferase [Saprospiraceae bacterium]|nr:GNAT family N-acetyltransferase [Saprospiraceae bacterium]
MEIRSLAQTSLKDLIDCLLIAFEDYFVPMPKDLNYWADRFKAARVELALSYGAFVGDQLVGFIIHGIDQYKDLRTAFNTGTGVIPEYRGQQLVDQIYTYSIPLLQKDGIQQCALEVIQDNHRAIRVYERIGFSITRDFLCFKGQLQQEPEELDIQQAPFEEVQCLRRDHQLYSWDNVNAAIQTAGSIYTTYRVKNGGQDIGFFIVNPKNGYLAQYEASSEDFPSLLAAVQSIHPTVRINNVDKERAETILFLLAAGLDNHIDQYEMVMKI